MSDLKYNPRDWVAWMHQGAVKHGEVMYVERDDMGHWKIHTTNGTVRDDNVLEVRHEKT